MKDIVIIGGGPVGLYAAFYAGIRGLEGIVLEAEATVGGQATKFFKDKPVYDFPGQAKTTGQGLTDLLLEQLNTVKEKIEVKTSTIVQDMKKINGGFEITIGEEVIRTKTICISVGPGTAVPRTLGLENEYYLKNISYFVQDLEKFKNKKVVVFGGGDSAVDWANKFKEFSDVSIIHRRDNFRAKAGSVAELESGVDIFKNHDVVSVNDQEILIKDKNDNKTILKYDEILVQYGVKTSFGKIGLWGMDFEKNKIKVDGFNKTSVEGIWAVGNACRYEGKIDVITSGLGDVISAMASIATYINPKASPVFYSTNKK